MDAVVWQALLWAAVIAATLAGISVLLPVNVRCG